VRKLDRQKPFGVVCGAATHRFEQDGVRFDAAGNEIASGAKPVPQPPVTEATKGSPVDAQVAAQLGGTMPVAPAPDAPAPAVQSGGAQPAKGKGAGKGKGGKK
jgi:hypothetical protein